MYSLIHIIQGVAPIFVSLCTVIESDNDATHLLPIGEMQVKKLRSCVVV